MFGLEINNISDLKIAECIIGEHISFDYTFIYCQYYVYISIGHPKEVTDDIHCVISVFDKSRPILNYRGTIVPNIFNLLNDC